MQVKTQYRVLTMEAALKEKFYPTSVPIESTSRLVLDGILKTFTEQDKFGDVCLGTLPFNRFVVMCKKPNG